MTTRGIRPTDVLREFIEDVRAAYTTGDSDGLDRDRLARVWPDLLVTFDKAVACLSAQSDKPESGTGSCWRCVECDRTLSMADWTYADLADRGIPVCGSCDQDMELVESTDDAGAPANQPVLVTVEGGIVQDVSNIPPGITLIVRDYDVEPNDDPDYPRDDAGHPYAESTWCGDD